jgi:hypothetical protein
MRYNLMIRWPQTSIYRAALLFVIAYPLCLLLWLPVTDYYAAGLGYGGAWLMPLFQEVSFSGLDLKKDTTVVKFDFHVYGSRINSGLVTLSTSHYVFNVPLIMALLIALGPFLNTKPGPVLVVMGLTAGTHFLHVVMFQNNEINRALISEGFATGGALWIYLRQYLFDFVEFLVLKFLPFLLGFYLLSNSSIFDEWVRFFPRGDSPNRPPK